MQSKAATVDQYLAELPEDRRAAISAVRKVILKNLDRDYEEGMGYGMIGYYVPHRVFPAGYHCDPRMPLPFASLASQKNHMAVYLMSIYGDESDEGWFRKAWAATGKKLDMGKCCVRFRKLDDLALDVIGEAIRRMPARKYIAYYQKAILSMNTRSAGKARSSAGAGAKKAGPGKRAVKPAAKRSTKKHKKMKRVESRR